MKEEYRSQVKFELETEDEDFYKHTYQEERRILDMVRMGNFGEAVRLSGEMDLHMARLASTEAAHWRNLVIVSVTLCTRAAIEGGLKPSTAYHISDYYIVKASEASDRDSILLCRTHAIEELTRRVRETRKKGRASVYVERCKDYVEQHFREKIYLDDLAKELGISGSYLSRLFKKETGMCLQDYVNDIRIHRAAHLLVYSEETIPRIAAYVNFPSQSYFGKLFKEKTGRTPRQYREENKTPEWQNDAAAFHTENHTGGFNGIRRQKQLDLVRRMGRGGSGDTQVSSVSQGDGAGAGSPGGGSRGFGRYPV